MLVIFANLKAYSFGCRIVFYGSDAGSRNPSMRSVFFLVLVQRQAGCAALATQKLISNASNGSHNQPADLQSTTGRSAAPQKATIGQCRRNSQQQQYSAGWLRNWG